MKNFLLVFMMLFALNIFAQSTHNIDFEPGGTGAAWSWTMTENGSNPPLQFVANPNNGGINASATAAKFIAKVGGNPWALCFTDGDGVFTFDATNSIVKIMVYKPTISNVGMKFEGMSGAVEKLVSNTLINQWEEITFNFSDKIGSTYHRIVIIPDFTFAPRPTDNVLYFDNIQVPDGYIAPPSLAEPTTVPPVPAHAAENVLSVYTEVYSNIAGTNFNPGWGQSTTVTVNYNAAGNNTLKYANLNYQGTQYTNQNVSGYEYLHIDFWTPNSTVLNFFLISPGNEKPYALPITAETWVSVDIPLSFYVPPVNLADVFQFKVDGNGTVYFDNWYFWKNPAGGVTDASLSDLKVDGTTVPGFAPNIFSYDVELPLGTILVPAVTATTTNPNATLEVNDALALPGTTNVVVTSENGSITKTYAINFTVAGLVPTSDYCETLVYHFGLTTEEASAIYLTIKNIDALSMLVEIESATADPVDLLIVTGGSGATISDQNTSIPGKISLTLTWASNPPANVTLNVLWSKLTFPGNWMLIQGDFTVPFEASCGAIEPKPYLALDIQDDFENNGWGNISNWKFQDAATLTNLAITTDPANPANHVADYDRSGTFDYTNTQFTLNHRMDLTSRRKFEMRVYFPSSNDYTGTLTPTAAIKLQNSLLGANAWTTQTVISQPVTQRDQWVTLTFNFTTVADSVNYDQIVVQLGGEGHFTPAQFYFDMFRLLPATILVVADFTATPRSGYAPLTVQFSDYSTGNPIAWKWDFNNDGVTDSQVQNPTYTYQTPGVYSVKLRAETQLKFSEITKSDFITVSELVLPDYTYTNFDDQINVEFSGLPNNPETVANPDVSGINTSANVGKWVRSAGLDSHIFTVLDSKIDFTNGQVFHLKLHSPVTGNVLFKLEDNLNLALPVERSVAITKVNQWENLVFNFAGTGSGLYDKITIFIDFGSANNNTFYFDDLLGPELEVPVVVKPYLALDVQDNFEDDGYATISEWNFQDPGIVPLPVVVDPLNPSNHVADYDRSGDFQYTNAQFILDHRMDLTSRNKFGMKVFFPSSNNYTGALTKTAAIKLQNSLLGGNAYTTQAEILVTVTQLDQWINLIFDFSAPEITSRSDFDQVVVQFGGEGHLVPAQFYFDDLELKDVSAGGNLSFYPTNGATGIDVFINPALNFTVPVTLANGNEILNSDIASIVTFKETNEGGASVPFTGTINATKTMITLIPDADLNYEAVYFVALNNEVVRYLDADLIAGQSITFTTAIEPKPYLAIDVRDNFENDGWGTIENWKFQDSPSLIDLTITTVPGNPSNHVAGYNRSGSFEWTNAQFILDHRMDLTSRNKFRMKVFFPSSNNYTGGLTKTAAIKLQNSLLGGLAYTTQAEILVTVTQLDQWVNLTFDFSAPEITARTDFDQVVVQFGGEGHLVPAQFYFDDFRLFGIEDVIQQTVQLTGGWSGISGYVVPDNTNLDDMLASLENLVILYNNYGIYMPSQGTNTLGNWNPAKGYIVKLTGSHELVIEGFESANPTLTLAQGWSIVPVISSCNVVVESLLGEYEQILMVKEVAGTGVYWPEKAINSLRNLVPGKAYFFLTNAAVSFTYPACGAK